MIELNGIFGELEVWGWPWHGVLESEPTAGGGTLEDYYLRRADGSRKLLLRNSPPYEDALGPQVFNSLRNAHTSARAFGGVTHQVRVPGHVMPPRSPEQLAQDNAAGFEWCDAAMLSSLSHNLYSQPLGQHKWLFCQSSARWLMELTFTSIPRPGVSPGANLSISIKATPFGIVGSPVIPATVVGAVTAPSCIDTSEAAGFLTHSQFAPVMIQSIRSDGAELILEVQRRTGRPSLRAIGAVGYYRLSVSRIEGSWVFALQLLKRSSELYSKTVTGALTPRRVGVSSVLVSEPAPGSGDPYVYNYVVVNSGPDSRVYLTAVGDIEQVSVSHCGYVYDEQDVLREVHGQVRITHACSVSEPAPQVSGQLLQWPHPSGPPTYDVSDPRTITINMTSSVTSTISAEVLLDGALAASTEAVLSNTALVTFESIEDQIGVNGPIARRSATWSEAGSLVIGPHTIQFSYSRAINDPSSLPPNWPVFASLYEWCGVAGDGALTPWPSPGHDSRPLRQLLTPQARGGLGGLPVFTRLGFLAGAARLANNVFVPCITAGLPGADSGGPASNWNIETTTGLASNGTNIPATQLGQPVGPGGPGLSPITFGSSDRQFLTPVEFDYLHARLASGGGVI
ncbi:hypothetical protein D9M68_364070 [compost metagenome]